MAKRKTKQERMNSITHHYRNVVCRGAKMEEVVEYALKKNLWPLPIPKDPFKMLVQHFTDAQRKETMFDDVAHQSYNANICYRLSDGDTEWIDLDEAKFEKYVENAQSRRDKAVGLLTQIEKNNIHWNRTHDKKEQYQMELNLGPDVLWNLNQRKVKKSKTN